MKESIIIRGGTVIDGTGRPGYRADVEVCGGKISAIGDLAGRSADHILNADGLTVAPGFIDAHAHSDTAFLKDDSGASKLYQGITTEVSGNCGSSPFPAAEDRPGDGEWRCASFEDFLHRYEKEGYRMGVSQAMLVGHGSLRECVAGPADRPVTAEELERMKHLLRRDLMAAAEKGDALRIGKRCTELGESFAEFASRHDIFNRMLNFWEVNQKLIDRVRLLQDEGIAIPEKWRSELLRLSGPGDLCAELHRLLKKTEKK